MSSLSSVFNSCSTLITLDVYRKLHPTASQKTLVRVGQVSTLALVAFGLAWIPVMQGMSDSLYRYIQSVQAYISPPIAAVFLLGVFWRRVNAQGAIAALAVGFVLGMARLVAEVNQDQLGDGLLHTFSAINFLHFAALLFVACAALMIIVSLATPPPAREKTAGMTFQTREEGAAIDPSHLESDSGWRRRDLGLTIVLLAVVGLVWSHFTG